MQSRAVYWKEGRDKKAVRQRHTHVKAQQTQTQTQTKRNEPQQRDKRSLSPNVELLQSNDPAPARDAILCPNGTTNGRVTRIVQHARIRRCDVTVQRRGRTKPMDENGKHASGRRETPAEGGQGRGPMGETRATARKKRAAPIGAGQQRKGGQRGNKRGKPPTRRRPPILPPLICVARAVCFAFLFRWSFAGASQLYFTM